VYQCRDPHLERVVRVKTVLVSPFQEGKTQHGFSRFQHEAQAAARLFTRESCKLR
jgi:hypothetical protein